MSGGVLVTGSTGFVGRVLCSQLQERGEAVFAGVRDSVRGRDLIPGVTPVVFNLDAPADVDGRILKRVSCIVHLAAQVHLMNPDEDERRHFDLRNAVATKALAMLAAESGVSRFVFVSSVKVNGERSSAGGFRSDDPPNPADPYAASKLRAEQALMSVAKETGLEVCIVRPPLVYGPGVGANFLRLLDWIDREHLLPLGAVDNKRSLVSVRNLCGFISLVSRHPQASGRTWMVSDGTDLSVPDLVRSIAAAMGKRARLLNVPVPVLKVLGRLTGRQDAVARLCDSLTVDVTQTRADLGWAPDVSVEEGLAETVEWYCARRRGRTAGGAA